MSRPHSLQTIYKDMSYAQLRAFCETARLGNMAAAARSLNLSHPTIWKQIRALEEQLGQPLLEVSGRRRSLTEAGQTLARMASTVVAEFETLQRRFHEACSQTHARLSIAASPRACAEDLPPIVEAFEQRYPRIRLSVHEAFEHEGIEMINAGEVDIVVASDSHAARSGALIAERCYDLEPILVMAEGHPLSRTRRIKLADLARFPLLNGRGRYPDPEVNAALDKLRAFDHPDRRYELGGASTIRECARRSQGVGIIARSHRQPAPSGLREVSLSHLFPPLTCYAYTPRRIHKHDAETMFIQLTRSLLQLKSSRKEKRPRRSREH